ADVANTSEEAKQKDKTAKPEVKTADKDKNINKNSGRSKTSLSEKQEQENKPAKGIDVKSGYYFNKDGSTGSFRDRVFWDKPDSEKEDEISKAAKKQPTKKLNVEARSFDPTTAIRNSFFIKTSSSPQKKNESIWESGKVVDIPWGTGRSFMQDRIQNKSYSTNRKEIKPYKKQNKTTYSE
ncbi:hypothetical protein NEMIN01_2431, partial [Nematocida minor]|uniref:uncharacterized protein n=1 Tax=Nematocida minor TaxID=1912983 RepID=UPI00221F9000